MQKQSKLGTRILSASIICTLSGFLLGFLTSAGLNLANDAMPLAGLVAIVTTVLVLFELVSVEPADNVALEIIPGASLT